MKFINPYWAIVDKINLLQRWLLVHSYLYYELDRPIVSDEMFDMNARQLVKMQEEHKEDYVHSRYYYAFKSFDGSTGFDLFKKLSDEHKDVIRRDATLVIERHAKWRVK